MCRTLRWEELGRAAGSRMRKARWATGLEVGKVDPTPFRRLGFYLASDRELSEGF